jgi:predicted nucleic acid-binding protein
VRKIFLSPSAIVAKAKYIFDTSPAIILLEKCGLRSHLLSFAKNCYLVAPNRVIEEYAIGDGENQKPDLFAFREVFSPINVKLDDELLPFFHHDSSSGEIWVISYARQHPDFTCVIDEAFGRNICELMSVKVIGTIGILREMRNYNILSLGELKVVRSKIKQCRFYLSKDLLRRLDSMCDSR